MQELPHPNIVHLRDVYCTKQKVFLVFEFVESDLKKYMKSQQYKLSAAAIQVRYNPITRADARCCRRTARSKRPASEKRPVSPSLCSRSPTRCSTACAGAIRTVSSIGT